jgi:hypothetical protein
MRNQNDAAPQPCLLLPTWSAGLLEVGKVLGNWWVYTEDTGLEGCWCPLLWGNAAGNLVIYTVYRAAAVVLPLFTPRTDVYILIKKSSGTTRQLNKNSNTGTHTELHSRGGIPPHNLTFYNGVQVKNCMIMQCSVWELCNSETDPEPRLFPN